MAKEIIDEIVAAETHAKQIIASAKATAEQMLFETEKEAKEKAKEAKEKANTKADSLTFAARQKGEAAKDKEIIAIEKECEQIKQNASVKLDAALEQIVSEIKNI